MKPQPKFVTKLFAAIDGYADIKDRNEQRAHYLSHSTRDVIKPLIERHNGVWMHEKDGKIFTNFKKSDEAVDAAVAVQHAVKNEPELKLRIGIHTGDIKSDTGSGDIIASGISGLTAPGGVCITDKVYAALHNTADVKAEFLKETGIQGVGQPVRV